MTIPHAALLRALTYDPPAASTLRSELRSIVSDGPLRERVIEHLVRTRSELADDTRVAVERIQIGAMVRPGSGRVMPCQAVKTRAMPGTVSLRICKVTSLSSVPMLCAALTP